MRVGIGYEILPFGAGRLLVLGGVKVAGAWGLKGPGDGDVVLRALAGALLGAAGLGAVEDHAPEPDPPGTPSPSAQLVAQALALVAERGLAPANVDLTVVAERPPLAAQREPMRARIASLLRLDGSRVNVKAVPHHGLGGLGHGEGIAALVVACLEEAP